MILIFLLFKRVFYEVAKIAPLADAEMSALVQDARGHL
jgi:hypothetical protein